MTPKYMRILTHLPENVLPSRLMMVDYILTFKEETGANKTVYDVINDKHVHTDGLEEIIQLFRECQEYYRECSGKAKGVYLDTKNMKLDRFHE
jgi:hypothetical protein